MMTIELCEMREGLILIFPIQQMLSSQNNILELDQVIISYLSLFIQITVANIALLKSPSPPSSPPHSPQTLAILSLLPPNSSFHYSSFCFIVLHQKPYFRPLFSVLACIEYSDNVKKLVPIMEERIRKKD